jgi:hypothetical protein
MNKLLRASVAAVVLFTNTAAMAQQSIEEASSTANRLLEGAEFGLMFDTGREIDAHGRISSVHSAGRCKTAYSFDYPNIDDIPESYRGRHSEESIDWSEDLSDAQAEGSKVFYNSIGNISGKMRRFHYRFGSASQAQAFAEAASVLVKACKGGGDDDNGPVDERVIDANGKVASLAIDKDNGNHYGWAVDYDTRETADERAIRECSRDGTNCHVVLRFTGGCGAYAVDAAKGSTAYGWGTADTRGAAEGRARSEVSNRGGTNIVTRVWGCNSLRPRQSQAGDAAAAARAEREKQFQEALRKHDEEVKAHDAAMQDYRQQLDANKEALEKAAARGEAAKSDYEAQLAKAKAAQEQYERDQQAYREEYKRLTGHYPEGN